MNLDPEGYDEPEDPLHFFALDNSVAGLRIGEAGLLLKRALEHGRLRLCRVAQIMTKHPPVGEAARDALRRDLLPLPCAPVSAEETLVHEHVAGGKNLEELRSTAGPLLRRAGIAAWVFLMVVVVNFLGQGFSAANSMW